MNNTIKELCSQTLFFRKHHQTDRTLSTAKIRNSVIRDSLRNPQHQINQLFAGKKLFIPFINERDRLGKLLSRETQKQVTNEKTINLKSLLRLPTNNTKQIATKPGHTRNSRKLTQFLNQDAQPTGRSELTSYKQKTTTTASSETFNSLFGIQKYQLLKHKGSEPTAVSVIAQRLATANKQQSLYVKQHRQQESIEYRY